MNCRPVSGSFLSYPTGITDDNVGEVVLVTPSNGWNMLKFAFSSSLKKSTMKNRCLCKNTQSIVKLPQDVRIGQAFFKKLAISYALYLSIFGNEQLRRNEVVLKTNNCHY